MYWRCLDFTNILIVEDDTDLQKLFRMILKNYNYTIIGIANNGNEALEKFKHLKNKTDIILMDHRMPGKNGLETTAEILKIDPKAKIIFISADTSIKDAAYSLGARGFVEKPFSINKLIKEINKNN